MTSLVSRGGSLASQDNQRSMKVSGSKKQGGSSRGLTQKQAFGHAPGTRKALASLDNSSNVLSSSKPSAAKTTKISTTTKHTVKPAGPLKEVVPPSVAPILFSSEDLPDIENIPALSDDTFSVFEEPLYFKNLTASLQHTTVTPFPSFAHITSTRLTLGQRPQEPWEDILECPESEGSGVSESLPAMPDINW